MPLGRIKGAIREVGAGIYHSSRLGAVRHRGKVVILTYHRVLREEDLGASFVQPGMYVLKAVFENQVRFLKERFEILSFGDLLSRWTAGVWDGRRGYCAITFDDGWRDNYLHAYPILRDHGIPATVFLPTAFIGTRHRFWWDEVAWSLRRCWLARRQEEGKRRWAELSQRYPWLELEEPPTDAALDEVIERFKNVPEREIYDWLEVTRGALGGETPDERALVDWREVEEMSDQGISFGSHSCTHRILTRLPKEEIREEVYGSRDALRARRIRFVPVFSYPNGNYNHDVMEEVKRAGYEAAVSGRFGIESECPEDVWALRRIGVHNDITRTAALFALRISGLSLA